MNGRTYTEFHPRWYRPRVSTWWWLKKRSYFTFMLRELSSAFVAWFVVYLLLLIYAVGQGPAEYQEFWDWAATPWVVVVNVIAFAFLLLHAVTWFNVTPQALVIRLGGRRVPSALVAGAHYGAWIVVSALLIWLLLE